MEEIVIPKSANGDSHVQTSVPQRMLTAEVNRSFTVGAVTQGQPSRWGGLWHEFLASHGPNEANSLSAATTSAITMSVTEGSSSATPHTEACNTNSQTMDTDHCAAERPFRYSTCSHFVEWISQLFLYTIIMVTIIPVLYLSTELYLAGTWFKS
jgi:hypothetical protein